MLLKDTILETLTPIFKQRGGKVFVTIALNWTEIAGKEFDCLIPTKLEYFTSLDKQSACLHLELIDQSRMLQVSFYKTEILRRIKTYFGFDIIEQLKIKYRK